MTELFNTPVKLNLMVNEAIIQRPQKKLSSEISQQHLKKDDLLSIPTYDPSPIHLPHEFDSGSGKFVRIVQSQVNLDEIKKNLWFD